MPFSVAAAVDRYVARLNEPREPDGTWHPSSIFACPRKATYEFRGQEPSNPPDERALRVFRMGTIIHEFVQSALLEDPAVDEVFVEVRIDDPDLGISGHADAVVRLRSGTWLVLELKSINSMAFRYKDLPKQDHRGQASVYLKVLMERGGIAKLLDGTPVILPPLGDGARVQFAYISKDDMKIEEFTMLWTPAKNLEILERIDLLEQHRVEGTLPERLPLVPNKKTGKAERDYQCRYCPFADLCWKDVPE